MSDRTVPYEENTKCDICGKLGVFDFMGDYICQECIDKYNLVDKVPCYRCGHSPCICGA